MFNHKCPERHAHQWVLVARWFDSAGLEWREDQCVQQAHGVRCGLLRRYRTGR